MLPVNAARRRSNVDSVNPTLSAACSLPNCTVDGEYHGEAAAASGRQFSRVTVGKTTDNPRRYECGTRCPATMSCGRSVNTYSVTVTNTPPGPTDAIPTPTVNATNASASTIGPPNPATIALDRTKTPSLKTPLHVA